MLGAALPAMLAEWHLNDRSGGVLLLNAFAGSTLGALFVQKRFHAFTACGLLCTALAAGYLAEAHGRPFGPAFFLYGLGLGLTMTAISLLRSREAAEGDSTLEMNRLNLLWAIGACLAPALALRSLHLVSVRTLFRAEATMLGMATVLLVLTRPANRSPEMPKIAPKFLPLVPMRLCLFAAAAVAIETAIGGWLTTYTERVAHGVGIAVWANTAFWTGLLLSRALHSLRTWPSLASGRVTAAHLAGVAAALALLVAFPADPILPIAALLAGLGLGPLYPLALSVALPHYRSSALFLSAGIGSALLPWLTGALSAASGSLRFGLLVPCSTVLILLSAAVSMRREITE